MVLQLYGSFDGNYNADLADRNSNVYKYWRNYRRNHKNWERDEKEINTVIGKTSRIRELDARE